MIIALTGFMGCGKSSIGEELSKLLGCPLADLDDIISSKAGMTIPEIFARQGEAAFRAMELAALREFLDGDEPGRITVLSLGGGTLTTPECAALVHDRTLCLYLRASVDTLVWNLENDEKTVDRPMLQGKLPLREKVGRLMAGRDPVYESAAHIIIDTDGKSFREAAEEIAGILPAQTTDNEKD